MNFAVVPFVFVIGLASLVYVISGRKWFTGPIRDLEPDGHNEVVIIGSCQESLSGSQIERKLY